MAGRMSNRDRIERLRAEADAAAKEKAAARAEKAARPAAARKSPGKSPGKSPSKTAPPGGRVRLAWNVCDQRGKPVKQFPYAQEQEARDEAARLTEESGRSHFVTKAEVPVD